jgi:hypothetical protein
MVSWFHGYIVTLLPYYYTFLVLGDLRSLFRLCKSLIIKPKTYKVKKDFAGYDINVIVI